MSKGAVGLVAGYWPEDVYRYLAIPGLALDEGVVSRAAKRRAQHPALLWNGEPLTYQQLAEETDKTMKALLGRLGDQGGRVAIGVQYPVGALKIFLGALKARLNVLLVDLSASAEGLHEQLSAFEPDWVVADEGKPGRPDFARAAPGIRLLSTRELSEAGTGSPRPRARLDLKAPAVAIPAIGERGGSRLVYHSHASLLAGAISWSTFLTLKENDTLLCVGPLSTWEGLYSVLPALFRGGTSALADSQEPDAVAEAVRLHRPRYMLLPLQEASRMASHRDVTRAIRDTEGLEGILVSVTGPFLIAERKRLAHLLGKPILTVLGNVEAGPIVASHPTWYLDGAVGIPVTNVDVWPLNPRTGNPLQIPWEAVEYGEIGVRSQMAAVSYQTPEEGQERIREGWLRTKVVATMDPNGLFYLRSALL